jgi:integrase
MMRLTDTAIRNLKPQEKPYKRADGQGLYLLVQPNGKKLWRQKIRVHGQEKSLSHGAYPMVSLNQARAHRHAALQLLAEGKDPATEKQLNKARERRAASDSFRAVTLEWFTNQKPRWTAKYASRVWSRLQKDALAYLGERPISEIHTLELLDVLRRVEGRDAIDTAHRLRRYFTDIFRYAVITKRANHNPAADLAGALKTRKPLPRAAITDPRAIGPLLIALDNYHGTPVVRAALQLAPLVFTRPGELRLAEWSEFDLDAAVWRIPASKMKMGEEHIVPLSSQALSILRELKPLTGQSRYVFRSPHSHARPISNNTINAALRRLGYEKDQICAHGFRSMASTLLNELGFNPDAIERQLAHQERNKVRAAYNRAAYMGERKRMMQAWANYLDELMAAADPSRQPSLTPVSRCSSQELDNAPRPH